MNCGFRISNFGLEGGTPSARRNILIRNRKSTIRNRSAFSLLEVVLAMAILVGAIAVMGELVRLGTLSAANARDLTQAQLICESKLNEIMAGITTADNVSYAPYESDPDWVYSIETATADIPGLMVLRVTVSQNLAPAQRPVEFSLTRLIQDPSVELTPAASVDTGQSSSSSSSTSGSTSGGTQ